MRTSWFRTTVILCGLHLIGGCGQSSFRGRDQTDDSGDPAKPVQTMTSSSSVPSGPLGAQFLSVEEVHEFKQVEGALQSVERIQGKQGIEVISAFRQGTYGPLDILVVVDNSASMAEEQQNLATKLGSLIQQVNDADWRVAVTTTDPQDPCLMGVILKGDPDAEARFATLVAGVGTKGTSLERPFLRAKEALLCPMIPGSSVPWMRPQSALAVVMVTDEDNCHQAKETGYGCDTEDKDPSFLLKAIEQERALISEARIYGIISQGHQPCSTALKTGGLIEQVVSTTGGVTGDICEGDYSNLLTEISGHVAKILKADLSLEFEPSPGTARVRVNGANWDRFTVQGRQLGFAEAPPFGSWVEVSYRYGKEGLYSNALQIPQVPLEKTLTIFVGDQSVGEGQFRFDPQSKMIEFSQTPSEGLVLRAQYLVSSDLKRVFPLGPGEVVEGSIRVWVQDRETSAYQYNRQTGDVILDVAPNPGAKVTVKLSRPRS